jgi:hypothetical protein
MINLVFSHLLNDEGVAPRMTIPRDVASDLRSGDGRQVLMRKCPTLVQTRWVYTDDVLRFIFQRIDDVDNAVERHGRDPVPRSLRTSYWILLPLRLFSLSIESRGRLPHEVLLIAKELRREYSHILPRLAETEEIDMVDKLTAHFIARLRINAFQDAATAWVLSIDGRERLRREEAHFLDRTSLYPRTDFTPLDCITEMREWFRDQFEPWNPTEVTAAQEDGIPIEAFAMEVDDARVPAFDILETPDDVTS